MTQTQIRTLEVPGASLYYEVTGSGPPLFMIGLPMDHIGFAAIVPLLADRYTVVTYDPRGFLNSGVADPGQDLEPDLVADDVHRLIAAVTAEPAYVLGSSGGAVTGLALTARHPEQVRRLIAHEPPVVGFLPDADRRRAQIADIHDTYVREGQGPAFGKFFVLLTGDDVPAAPPAMGDGPPSPEMMASGERMMARSLLPTTEYLPDPAALAALADRIVIGVGVASEGQYPNRTAVALAERAGLALVRFPGGHGGFGEEPEAFAARLVEVLTQGA